MQNHGKQAFINYIAYQTTCSGYAHTSHGNRALGTDQNTVFFPSCRGSAHVRENRMEKISFLVIYFILPYIFSANSPVRILSEVSMISVEYAAQFEGKSYWEILL